GGAKAGGPRGGGGEGLVLPRRAAVREGDEYDAEAGLGERRAVPRAVEGEKHSAVVVRTEHGARVHDERHRRPVSREHDERLRKPFAAIRLLTVAAVLGSGHSPAAAVAVVAVGPAKVVVLLHHAEFLCRILGADFFTEAPVLVQLVATVHGEEEIAGGGMHRERHGIAQAGGPAEFGTILLP